MSTATLPSSPPTVQPVVRIDPEELARNPEYEGCELIDGVPVERGMSNKTVRIGGNIHLLLSLYATRTNVGEALPDKTSYRCFPSLPDVVRIPDASFFLAANWDEDYLESAHVEEAPDLIVEVVSPNDNAQDLAAKVAEFFAAGTQEAWIVYPHIARMERHFATGAAKRYGVDDVLVGDPLLPGFEMKLRDVLGPMNPAVIGQ